MAPLRGDAGESTLDRCAALALLLASILSFLALLYFHLQLISVPTPIDFYEGAMPQFTAVIAAGGSPYSFESQPSAMNVYPPVYNIIVAPLTAVFENNLQLHRAVSAVFIWLSCMLCGLAAWRAGRSLVIACSVATMLYAGFLFNATPIAGTSATGLFFFLLSVLIPWYRRFSNMSLAIALCLGLLGFYSKQYYGAGLAMLCAFMFLAGDVKRSIIYGLCVGAALFASLAIVQTSQPYYLDNTYFGISAIYGATKSYAHAWQQLVSFATNYLGVLALLSLALLLFLLRGKPEFRKLPVFFREHDAGFFLFCLFCSSSLILLFIGRNPGNEGSYLFQLMSPFLLLALAATVSKSGLHFSVLTPLLIWNIISLYLMLPKDIDIDREGWDEVEEIIANSDKILGSSILVSTLVKYDKPIHQNGHTFYFLLAKNKPAMFKHSDQERQIEAVWERFIAEQYRQVVNKEFDALLLTSWDVMGIFKAQQPPDHSITGMELVNQHYRRTHTIPVSLGGLPGGRVWNINVWRPKATQLLSN